MNEHLYFVHPNAKIGQNVKIEPFAVIYDDVVIGDNCWIGPHVTVFPGARIGNNCNIFPGASIAAIPQDLKFNGEYTTAEIGNNNTIREFVTINRGTNANKKTVVGNNNLIMAYTHIAHDCTIGNNCILANSTTLAGHISIDDYAIVGGQSAIHQFTRIGKHVILMGGSLVDKDIPPYVKAGKFPVSYCGINSVGLHRRGFSQETINKIQELYRIVFQQGLTYTNALKELKDKADCAEAREIISFMESAERGLMKGFTSVRR